MQFLSNGIKNFILIRKFEPILLLNALAVYPNRKLTQFTARIDVNFDAGFFFDISRHTGGKQTIVKSNFTISYGDFFH